MNIIYKNNLYTCFLLVAFMLLESKVAHAQDVVTLQPERATIIQYIMKDNPVLVGLLTTGGLVPVLSGDGPYTLLAPPEQELASLKNESPDKIRDVLSGYVLKGNYLEKDLKDGAAVETLKGSKLKICRKEGTLVNGVLLADPDHKVRNGVVHKLQGMLN